MTAPAEDIEIGHVAVNPATGEYFCCDDDACVVMASPSELGVFIQRVTGEPVPTGALVPLRYSQVVTELMSGAAMAFDATSYQLFAQRAEADNFDAPAFDQISMAVESTPTQLGILELDIETTPA